MSEESSDRRQNRFDDYTLGLITGRLDAIGVQMASLAKDVHELSGDIPTKEIADHEARIKDLEERMVRRAEWQEQFWGKFITRTSGFISIFAGVVVGVIWLVKHL